MCEIKFHVKLPIFVARQWIRHRTASVNEYSARYSILDKEFYIPDPEQIATQSTANRQGRGETLDTDHAAEVMKILRDDAEICYEHYTDLLNDPSSPDHDPNRPGLARELARMNLTLNTYTQWYWKVNLRNLFHFLGLRADPHAQYEIRIYAEHMLKIVEAWVPISTKAFIDYEHEGVRLSRMDRKLIRDMIASPSLKTMVDDIHRGNENDGSILKRYEMSKRELGELYTKVFD